MAPVGQASGKAKRAGTAVVFDTFIVIGKLEVEQ